MHDIHAMIYSQLVDTVRHHTKDRYTSFLEGRKEIGGQGWYSRVIEVATKVVELLYRCQISDAVNGIWLVVKAASLIPWTP